MALQMVWKADDKEQVLELVETPTMILIQFCDLMIRKQDLRNPDVQYMMRENINALKIKAEKEPDDCYTPFNRRELKEYITQVEGLLMKFEQEQS